MATDVVPALNQAIQASFKGYVLKDRRIASISKRIRDGTATFVDAHDYAERLGENLSRALVNNLTADKLPDGRLYYNIAQRTVVPGLQENYDLANVAASDIQDIIFASEGIGIKAAKADFPEERIQGLIDKMTAEGITLERAIIWLQEPIINNSEAFVDDFIKENAKQAENVGLKATLTRIADPGCCEWCAKLAGVYEYGKAPRDIYRRHEFCRCTVTYQAKKTSQNVWSKKQWQSSPEELARREQIGQTAKKTPTEMIQQADQLYQDALLQGASNRRKAAQKIRKMTPEERLQKLKELEESREKRG